MGLGDFNPRPREEGDLSVKASSQISNYFNPRPREEGDVITHVTACQNLSISIHALVKRATLSVKASSQISNYFNPRPREEGDADAGAL